MFDIFNKKYFGFIVSGGRTGTHFLGNTLGAQVSDCFSEHEPDLFQGFDRRTFEAIKRFGVYHMVLGRYFGKTGIRNITEQYLSGKIDAEDVRNRIVDQRKRYYQTIQETLIIESYYQWYGLLPMLSQIYKHYRVLAVVRDPRTWVQSWVNKQSHYDSKDLVHRFGKSRINPNLVNDADYARRWAEMSVFEKICWNWYFTYSVIDRAAAVDKKILVVKFEELFGSEDEYKVFEDAVIHLTKFSDRKFNANLQLTTLNVPSNKSNSNVPDWSMWDRRQARQLHAICGELMQKFQYGTEDSWRELLS